MTLRQILLAPAFLFIGLLLAGCGSPEEKEAAYIKHGNALFEQGAFEKARVEYKNAARIKPTDPEVAYRLGLVDEAEGDLRGAFDNFNHAEEQNAHYHPAHLKLAEYYIAAEQYDEAQSRIESVLTDTPDDAGAHALQAALALRRKDFANTEKEARLALAKDPANVISFSVLSGLYSTQGDDAKALVTINEGLAHNPHNLPLLFLRAQLYEKAGDLAKTAESYQTIFSLAPRDTRYRVNLAAIYLKAGQLDNAEATLRAGVAALPDDWDMKHQLVTFLSDHRGLDVAEKEIRDLMKAYPQKSELYGWLTELYMSHNAPDRAAALLRQMVTENQFDKEGLAARTALAHINYIQGDKDAAQKLVSAVLEKDPNNLDALFIKARLEFDKGFYQDAITDLRAIIRDQPKAAEALHLMSETLLLQGHLDLAIDTLQELVDMDPLNLAAKVRLAQMYHQSGDSKRAMDLLFSVTKEDPKYALGWESTARIAIDGKDWETAETAIHNLDGLDGQHLTAVFLRGEMLGKTQKSEDAITAYKEVIDADPAAPLAEHALTALVAVYQDLGRTDEAIHYIESLKVITPTTKTILGESHLLAGKADQAAADFDMAISNHATRQEPYLDRARMFLYDHKTDEALDTLKKAAAADPADVRAAIMEAQILGEHGRYEEAIALYDELLARNPDLDAIANNLAEIIADYDYKDPAALEKARHVAERFTASSNPLLLDTLAWVYYRQGDIQNAATTMKRAFIAVDTLPPQIHYHYGAILLKSGNTAQAKTELQKATVPEARYPGLEDAKNLLSGL